MHVCGAVVLIGGVNEIETLHHRRMHVERLVTIPRLDL